MAAVSELQYVHQPVLPNGRCSSFIVVGVFLSSKIRFCFPLFLRSFTEGKILMLRRCAQRHHRGRWSLPVAGCRRRLRRTVVSSMAFRCDDTRLLPLLEKYRDKAVHPTRVRCQRGRDDGRAGCDR